MKLVQKGNKQMRVPDERVEDFLAKGYSEVDEKTGKLIQKKSADKEAALKKENADLKRENRELREQLAKLSGLSE